MKIYYVRHGQTDWNLEQRMQGGQSEKPLNATGIEQAKQAKETLKNREDDMIIRSTMYRVEQTTNIINEGRDVPILIDERIIERKLGEIEGKKVTEELHNNIWDYNLNYQIQGGENLHEFEKRILDFIQDIKSKYDDKTLLIVAHGGVAKVLKAHYFGMPKSKNLIEIEVQNCEIIELEI